MHVLFLDSGFDSMNEIFRKEREKVKNVSSKCLYNKVTKRGIFYKLVQFIGIYLFPPILYCIYGDWKYKVKEFDIFIIPSRRSASYAAKYIKKKTNARVIIWYWNTVTKNEMSPIACQRKGYETWSFDINDCNKYNMKFGDTYYFDIFNQSNEKVYDIFYVGINQPGRKDFLENLSKFLNKKNVKYKFNLCALPNDVEYIQKQFDRRLEYNEVLEYISKSDVILDLNKEKQYGMTLRPLEALFFNKKLITNNKQICLCKKYPLDNVFIINNNNFEELYEFLKEPLVNVSNNKDYYLFENWLKRIIEDIEADKINDFKHERNE